MVTNVSSLLWPGRAAALERRGARRRMDAGATRFTAAGIERDVTADLKIVTKDGDTVTISASIDTSATYASLLKRGGSAGAAELQTQSSVTLQVQGDLDAQEQADIAQVVQRFLQDLGALASGRDVSIANVAAGGPQTLQSIAADATTQTTIEAVAGALQGDHGPAVPVPASPASGALAGASA